MGPSVRLTIFAALCSRDPSHRQLCLFSGLLGPGWAALMRTVARLIVSERPRLTLRTEDFLHTAVFSLFFPSCCCNSHFQTPTPRVSAPCRILSRHLRFVLISALLLFLTHFVFSSHHRAPSRGSDGPGRYIISLAPLSAPGCCGSNSGAGIKLRAYCR